MRHTIKMTITPKDDPSQVRTVEVTNANADQNEIDHAHASLAKLTSVHAGHASHGKAKQGQAAFTVVTQSIVDGVPAPGIGDTHADIHADAVAQIAKSGFDPIFNHTMDHL